MEDFKIGQAWVCNAINGMPPLMCIVGRIDAGIDDEQIISVRIKPHPDAEKNGWPIVDHVPMSTSALQASSLRKGTEDVAATDGFEEGYAVWKDAYDSGKAGVFSIPLSKVYKVIVTTQSEGDIGS